MPSPQPKYAAGSDMDSIRTGRPVRPNGNGVGPFAAILAIIVALTIFPKLKARIQEQPTPTPTQQTTPITQTPQTAEPTPTGIYGKPEAELTEMVLSSDYTKVTLKLEIINKMTKPVTKTEITYTVSDMNGNEIASSQKTITQTIMPSEKYEDTEIIDLGSPQTNGLTANTNLLYHYWN